MYLLFTVFDTVKINKSVMNAFNFISNRHFQKMGYNTSDRQEKGYAYIIYFYYYLRRGPIGTTRSAIKDVLIS